MGYAENMYQWLKRNGYADKYDHAGIYCIKIDNIIVYIGKSTNMLRRVAEHYAAIKGQETRKYRILGPDVKFCVSVFRQSQEWHWKAGRILA